MDKYSYEKGFQDGHKCCAYEKEKLKAENARIWELHNDFLNNNMASLQKEIHTLRATNARYRQALELILESELLRHSPFVGYSEAVANAREALKGE